MPKLYFVVFNPDLPFDFQLFHNHILRLYPSHISDWWHHLNVGYIIASTHDVNTLYNLIFPGVPGRNLLVIEVNPNNAQGWLPKMAWDWIQKYQTKE